MKKTPFVNLEQIQEIVKTYPTPFHIYDEKAIRDNAIRLHEAFSWNKGFKEYFAVKATPNPFILKLLQSCGCGVDCSSMTELMLANALDFGEGEIMFSSNVTPAEEYVYAREIGATINLDDFTHIDFLERNQISQLDDIPCLPHPLARWREVDRHWDLSVFMQLPWAAEKG